MNTQSIFSETMIRNMTTNEKIRLGIIQDDENGYFEAKNNCYEILSDGLNLIFGFETKEEILELLENHFDQDEKLTEFKTQNKKQWQALREIMVEHSTLNPKQSRKNNALIKFLESLIEAE